MSQPAVVKDFWSALPAFLESHYSKADAAAIAAALDRLHYSGLKAFNYEDVEDFAAVMAGELGLHAPAPSS